MDNSQTQMKLARLSEQELQALKDFEYDMGAKLGSDVYLIAINAVPDMFFT